MKSLIIYLALASLLLLLPANVYASGIRHDTGDDATNEEAGCWIDGYDSGFAGKFDSDRFDECSDNREMYNYRWTCDKGCEDSQRTEAECNELINNPVEIQDFSVLKGQNSSDCYQAGQKDGKDNRPFDEERENGCYEFDSLNGGYEGGYQQGCEQHTAESTCELKYEDKRYYCPDHPDVVGCTQFLHNATNKILENATVASTIEYCSSPGTIYVQESNPERYCLKYDDPYCKTVVGDLCDEDGFVKPEYPYCK